MDAHANMMDAHANMDAHALLCELRAEFEAELTGHILPYWGTRTVDAVYGGFVGRITAENVVEPEAEKGCVLNARILWTFSAAHRALGAKAYQVLADRAYDYLVRAFRDRDYGGLYWMLDHAGVPSDERKHVYAQAFGVYAFTEYHRATGSEEALEQAISLFRLIEAHAYDTRYGGYFEAFSRTWELLDDVRLSDKDANEPKSMNTHLHVLEAYAQLYRAWPDPILGRRLAELVTCFEETILDPETHHATLFFDVDWTPRSQVVSYGHDIETGWLLLDAAEAVGGAELRERVAGRSVAIARATLEEGRDADGALFNERGPGGEHDTDKHWWPQAEAVVGFLGAYEESGDATFLEAARDAWAFTKRHLLDREHGEWHFRVSRAGVPYDEDKVGPWKCPYHSARACLEVMRRADRLGACASPTHHPQPTTHNP